MTSFRSLCRYLLCTLSSRVWKGIEPIKTVKYVDEAALPVLNVSITSFYASLWRLLSDVPSSTAFWRFNIERYNFHVQAVHTTRTVVDHGSSCDHRRQQIVGTVEEERDLLPGHFPAVLGSLSPTSATCYLGHTWICTSLLGPATARHTLEHVCCHFLPFEVRNSSKEIVSALSIAFHRNIRSSKLQYAYTNFFHKWEKDCTWNKSVTVGFCMLLSAAMTCSLEADLLE